MKYDDYIERHAPRPPVVFIRLYLGAYFIYCAVHFFTSGLVHAPVFKSRLQQLLDYGQLPVLGGYFTLLARIPTQTLASFVLAVCLMVGISLLLGLYVRPFGVLGLIFLLHGYFLGYFGPTEVDLSLWSQHTLALRLREILIVTLFVVVWTAAGRTWGVDGMVWRRRLKHQFVYPENPEFDPLHAADQDQAPDDPADLLDTMPSADPVNPDTPGDKS